MMSNSLAQPLSTEPLHEVKNLTDSYKSQLEHRSFRQDLLIVLVLVALNFVLAESTARLLVSLGQPELGRTKTYDRKLQLASQPVSTNPLIFFLGDSITDFSIYPERLKANLADKGTAVEARNLGAPGATPNMNLLILKRAVKTGVKPDWVIYNLYPRIFNRSFMQPAAEKNANNYVFEDSYLWRCTGGARQPLSGQMRCLLEKNLYLVRYRSFLKTEWDKLGETLLRPEKRQQFAPADFPERETSPGGWAPGYAVYAQNQFAQKFRCSDLFAQGIHQELGRFQWSTAFFDPFLKYCQDQRIRVLLVWLPEHPYMAHYYQINGLSHAGLAKQFNQYARQRKLTFVDFKATPLTGTDFLNLDHVNPSGAMKITDRMSALLLSPEIGLREAAP